MDLRGIPSVKSQKVSPGIITALTSAVLEWLLLSMLFINASFSYLITKFARYCELQIPCLLCSRLDHVLGNEEVGFYWDLICGNHKFEISSLVLCRAHCKLVDVHGICESCLFSFAAINKSNAETYRLLVAKLGDDVGLDQDPLLGDHILGSSDIRTCSCCNEQWTSRGYAPKLLQAKSNGFETAELDAALSVTVAHNRDDLKKTKDESSVSLRASPVKKNSIDPLPHIEYTKVKVTSDTESEAPFSDDDSASALIRESEEPQEDGTVHCVQMEAQINTLTDGLTSEKLIHLDSVPEPSLLESEVQLKVTNTHGGVASASAVGHGLEELNWQSSEDKANVCVASQLISFSEAAPLNSGTGTFVEASAETLDAARTGQVGKKLASGRGEISKAGSELMTIDICSELNPATSDSGTQMSNFMDLGDAYKLAVGNRGRQLSGKLLEQRSLKDSARLSEDLKLLLSQISAARGIDLTLNDISPRVSGNGEEWKSSDTSSSIGMQILQRRISLERNESGLSLDGSTVSEIEGESVVDRLKRQVEHDRKLMGTLYKELEEERNASAVAANQAMAMITRLQEEKAELHMEALQYLRMMDEQAEYDGEALQKANDLLAEKEKVIQDLEAAIDLHKKFGGVSNLENMVEPTCDLKSEEMRAGNANAHCAKNIVGATKLFGDENINATKNSFFGVEDERSYILQCLKKLEKKLDLFSKNGVHLDMYSGEDEHYCGQNSQENGATEENDLKKDTTTNGPIPHAQGGGLSSCEDPKCMGQESSEIICDGQNLSGACADTAFEFSDLVERLETLEVDCSFLEHSISSLRNGEEGLKFIQEIACHLRELRMDGIRRKDHRFA
ncbi:unnamed protein product [Ilex paraguariensis]|uniref:GTD-binding domain-containing protein n=1 Tax=Ilex paraguariensis TaxID=185542 RepID=A0ABC8RHN8_9AQUA